MSKKGAEIINSYKLSEWLLNKASHSDKKDRALLEIDKIKNQVYYTRNEIIANIEDLIEECKKRKLHYERNQHLVLKLATEKIIEEFNELKKFYANGDS